MTYKKFESMWNSFILIANKIVNGSDHLRLKADKDMKKPIFDE